MSKVGPASAHRRPVVEEFAAGWPLGVALVASGSWGKALGRLAPLTDRGIEPGAQFEVPPCGWLAASTTASIDRQHGWHKHVRVYGRATLEIAEGYAEAKFDAEPGLASDAVGLNPADEALLEDAHGGTPKPDSGRWRQRVRVDLTTYGTSA